MQQNEQAKKLEELKNAVFNVARIWFNETYARNIREKKEKELEKLNKKIEEIKTEMKNICNSAESQIQKEKGDFEFEVGCALNTANFCMPLYNHWIQHHDLHFNGMEDRDRFMRKASEVWNKISGRSFTKRTHNEPQVWTLTQTPDICQQYANLSVSNETAQHYAPLSLCETPREDVHMQNMNH